MIMFPHRLNVRHDVICPLVLNDVMTIFSLSSIRTPSCYLSFIWQLDLDFFSPFEGPWWQHADTTSDDVFNMISINF